MADSFSLNEFVRHLSHNATANNFSDMTSVNPLSKTHQNDDDDDDKNNNTNNNNTPRSPASTSGIKRTRLSNNVSAESSPTPTSSVSFGHVDMKKLEHCARTLQKQIRIIINEAPDLNKLSSLLESPIVDEDVKHEIQRNPLVQMAAAIKSKYLAKDLEIFDDILTVSVTSDRQSKEMEEQSNASEKSISDGDSDPAHSENAENEVVSRDDDDEDEDALPPLPSISNLHLLDRVFIHKSTLNDRTYLSEKELIASHNERLEFLGDSILNNVVTMIIYERFEHSPEGDLSKIRSQLVNNKTLAEFAMAYGLNKRLRSNISDVVLKQGNQKIFADVFEAYIGALAIENNMELTSIKIWLNKILSWKLKEFDQEINGLEPVNKNAKTDLYSLIGTAAFHPQYKVVETGDGATKPFIIRCEMGSDVLGEGVAPSSKEAGLRAAMQALKNRTLLEKYGQIRLSTDRSESKINPKLLLNKYQQYSSDEPTVDYTGHRSVTPTGFNFGPNPYANTPPGAAVQNGINNFNPPASSTTNAVPNYNFPNTYSPSSDYVNAAAQFHNQSGNAIEYQSKVFPVIGSEASNFLPEAKNDLYAILNKKGIVPEYRTSVTEDKFKVELHLYNVLVAIGVDSTKKKAATRAAMALLKNKDALLQVENLIPS